MEEPGELDVALLVIGVEPGELREVLDTLPGPGSIKEIIEQRLSVFGHSVNPIYIPDDEWEPNSPAWRYSG